MMKNYKNKLINHQKVFKSKQTLNIIIIIQNHQKNQLNLKEQLNMKTSKKKKN